MPAFVEEPLHKQADKLLTLLFSHMYTVLVNLII